MTIPIEEVRIWDGPAMDQVFKLPQGRDFFYMPSPGEEAPISSSIVCFSDNAWRLNFPNFQRITYKRTTKEDEEGRPYFAMYNDNEAH